VVGEPEASRLVEHEVVGAAQWSIAASAVKGGDLAGCEIDAVNAASRIARRRHHPEDEQIALAMERKAASIVADINRAVGPHRGTIGSTAEVRGALDTTVGGYSRERAGSDFGYQNRPVRQGDRTLRKRKTRCDDSHLGCGRARGRHRTLHTCLRIRACWPRIPRRTRRAPATVLQRGNFFPMPCPAVPTHDSRLAVGFVRLV
jgi:hypothetical protein